ncbi:MAG: TlpA family protein disulfide reductase [Clostridia bacterium]|nr:TlpA family protein disulfide reductase [Clostridia bacterium]
MKKIIIWIVIAALFVGGIVGAGALYRHLGADFDGNDQLQQWGDGNPADNPADDPAEDEPTEDGLSGDVPVEDEPIEDEPVLTFTAPDFTVLDENGSSIKLSDFVGKPIVVNFWATWCYYCKEEMPDFERAYQAYPDVQFVMVNATDNVGETVTVAKEYIANNGYTFDVFFDTKGEALDTYGVTGFPMTFFISASGDPIAYATGMLDYETLIRGIEMIT